MKKYLITSALPYANGPLHFGHLAGVYLPSDVYYRHHKLLGSKCMHICGSDEHGVAIMLNAKKAGKNYREYVDSWNADHKKLFDKYCITFDYFGRTSEKYHEEETVRWFKALYDKGMIGTKDGQQLQCKDCKNHLPDRFVEGTCYICGHQQARGDECPKCGNLMETIKLINPVCKICGSKDIATVKVTQYYLLLSKFHEPFMNWFKTKAHWRKTVYPFVMSLSEDELTDRAISRDLDWGIDVPLPEAKGKKLYVWFDAPIGYVSNTKKYLEEIGSKEHYLKDWWKSDDTEIIHFLGKDNIIFHCIIFPVMGMASGIINPPTDVPANQYLNLEGKQFSKSSGWYVDAHKALDDFGPDALRYYLLSILPENSDSSFTWKQFQEKVNNELANNIGNLVQRCLKFWMKNWPNGIEGKHFKGFAESPAGKKFAQDALEHKEILASKQIKKGLEKVMAMGNVTNLFFSDQAPWAQYKTDPELAATTIAQTSLQILALGVLLSPYLPKLSENIFALFGPAIDQKVKMRLYAGDLKVLDEVFGKGFALSKAPEVLVPKIEDKVITGLEAELKSITT